MQTIAVSFCDITEQATPPMVTVAPVVEKLPPEIVMGTFPAVGKPLLLEIEPTVGVK